MKLEKITYEIEGNRRRYDDACGAAHGLELVGERWALLVLREMMYGPRRFGDLKIALTGISANVLTQRLAGLEAAGIVERRKLPPPASVQVYGLTAWGLEAEPIFQELGRWAARSPHHDPTLPLSPVSLMMSLRTMIVREAAEGVAMTVGFVFGEETFVAQIADGTITAARGPVDTADFVLTGTPPAVAGLVYGKVPLTEMEAAGALSVSGQQAKAEQFATLFQLPPKVDSGA